MVPWRGSFTGALLGSTEVSANGEIRIALPSASEVVVVQANPVNRYVQIRSREYGASAPVLEVVYTDGSSGALACVADSVINSSDVMGLGEQLSITLGKAVMRFEVPVKPVKSTTLVMYAYSYNGAVTTIEACDFVSPMLPAPGAVYGLRRRGLSGSTLIKQEDFSSPTWWYDWYTRVSAKPTAQAFDIVTHDGDTGEPLGYTAYMNAGGPDGRVHAGPGLSESPSWWFPDHEGAEREEVYFQYRLRLGEGWRGGTLQSGKLPGIMGDNTYCDSGLASNGRNGWHFRMGFEGEPFAPSSPYNSNNGVIPVGWYTYNPEQIAAKTGFGLHTPWTGRGNLGLIEIGKDYWIDMYIKVNTPGQHDGIVRGWINGQLAFERTDYMLRDLPPYTTVGPKNAIQRIWMCFLHGGDIVPRPCKILRTYWSNWTIATEYIGPP